MERLVVLYVQQHKHLTRLFHHANAETHATQTRSPPTCGQPSGSQPACSSSLRAPQRLIKRMLGPILCHDAASFNALHCCILVQLHASGNAQAAQGS
jgi:hypothetical protein